MALPHKATEEKNAHTTCVKQFTKAIKKLEERIVTNLSSTEIETAEKKVCKTFNKLEEAQEAYAVAKQGSEAEGVSDNPEDVQWMDKHRNTKT